MSIVANPNQNQLNMQVRQLWQVGYLRTDEPYEAAFAAAAFPDEELEPPSEPEEVPDELDSDELEEPFEPADPEPESPFPEVSEVFPPDFEAVALSDDFPEDSARLSLR